MAGGDDAVKKDAPKDALAHAGEGGFWSLFLQVPPPDPILVNVTAGLIPAAVAFDLIGRWLGRATTAGSSPSTFPPRKPIPETPMPTDPHDTRPINRRQLMALAATSAAAAPTSAPAADANVFDVGSLDGFGEAKVYDAHRDDGFFVIRTERQVEAPSSVCTHRGCLVSPRDDGSFKCQCHGSLFSPAGKVLKGPAKRDLPRLAVKLDAQRHVLVDSNRELENPA